MIEEKQTGCSNNPSMLFRTFRLLIIGLDHNGGSFAYQMSLVEVASLPGETLTSGGSLTLLQTFECV